LALKNYEVVKNTHIGWERKLYDFIVNQKPADAGKEFTIQRPDAVALNIRYLYSSPDAASIEVSHKRSNSNGSYTMILIKINDDYYCQSPWSKPNQKFHYVVELVAYKTKNKLPTDTIIKYNGWVRMLFDFIADQKPADNEFTIQLAYTVTLNIRYLYSSPDAASIEVSYKLFNESSTRILIKINDDYYDAYPNEVSWLPSDTILAAIYP
jgi:hypothetical protein